jgi:hypothetical protein
MMDSHGMNQNGMQGGMSMSTGMEGLQSHQDQFMNLDMGLTAGFDGGVSMG